MSADFPVVTRYEVQGTEDIIQANARILESFKRQEIGFKDYNKALRESMENVTAESRYLRSLSLVTRVQNAEILQLGRSMASFGALGRNLLSMWQAYTIGQIRVVQAEQGVAQAQLGVAKAHKKAQDAQAEVTKWQKLYNQYLRDFGADSAITKSAYDSLTDAQEYLTDAQSEETSAQLRVAEAMERAAAALENLKIGYVSMGLQIPSFVSDIIRTGVNLTLLYRTIERGGGVFAALASGVSSLSGAFGGLGLVLASIATPFGLILATSKDAQEQTASFLNQLASLPERIGKEAETHPWWHWIPFAGLFEPNEQPAPAPYTPPTTTTAPYKKYKWLQSGTPYVPETGLYGLHKGERVLTEKEARMLRQTSENNFKIILNVYPPPNTTNPEAIAQYTLEKMKKWFATGIAM